MVSLAGTTCATWSVRPEPVEGTNVKAMVFDHKR